MLGDSNYKHLRAWKILLTLADNKSCVFLHPDFITFIHIVFILFVSLLKEKYLKNHYKVFSLFIQGCKQ